MPDHMQGLPSTRFAKAVTGTTNPTPADLAALAGRLEEQITRLESLGMSAGTLENQRLAARCVRAWAKLEKLLVDYPGASASFVVGQNGVIYSTVACLSYNNASALAAVEAAPEVES